MKWFYCFCFILIGNASSLAKPRVVATTLMIYDSVKNIAGDTVELQYLMGPGSDPHLYKPTAGDLFKIKNAALVVYNGAHLEGKMLEVLGELGDKAYKVTGALEEKAFQVDPQGVRDPHIWFDPALWVEGFKNFSKHLGKIIPNQEKQFLENYQSWSKKVLKVAQEGKEKIQTIPAKNRLLITSHDAFQYFGHYFGIEVIGVQGLSTQSQAGLRDIYEIVKVVKERKIPAIFVESSVSPATIQKVQSAAQVKIGGELFSDSMGKVGSPEGTYIGMLQHNINTIVNGLTP